MKYLFLILSLLLFANIGKAQVKPAQSQYLKEKGFLINPGFEQAYKGWDISGTCSKSLVTDIPYLNKSLKITCVNQNFSVKQETTKVTDFQGQQGVYSLQVKASVDGSRVSEISGGSRTSEIYIYPGSTYKRISNIPYIVNSISNGIEFYSDSNVTGEFIIDDVSLRLSYEGFVREDLDDVPVGTILSYGSETVPEGYLLADGSCISRAEYASLFAVIGTSAGSCDSGGGAGSGFNVPDLQNSFLRGLTSGRSVFDTQLDATAVNGLTTSPAGAASGSISAASSNNANGAITGASGVFSVSSSTSDGVQNGAGNTSYRTANMSIPNHNHGITGDSETRPENKSVVYIIKAIGRNTQNIVSQKTTSPDKAGFIVFSISEVNIEGHHLADGSCLLKESYPDYVANVPSATDCTINTSNDGFLLPNLQSNNRFLRVAGGSLAVGTFQNDATAVNGLSVVSNGNHDHATQLRSNAKFGTRSVGSHVSVDTQTQGSTTSAAVNETSQDGSHSHGLSGDSETRPFSYAVNAYVRLVDRDEIKGVFEQIKTDELIQIHYTRQTGSQPGILSGTYNTIAWDTQKQDNSNGAVNAGGGTFTSPRDARTLYRVCAASYTQAVSHSNGSRLILGGFINDVHVSALDWETAWNTQSFSVALEGCADFYMNKNDVLKIKLFQETGGTISINGGNPEQSYIMITEQPDTQAIVANLNDNAVHRIGDCKFSVLSDDDFNKIHSGSWVRLAGQSLAGTDIANRFGITSFPDAVSNGAFIRQQGGNSAALRTFQDDATAVNGLGTNSDGAHNHVDGFAWQGFGRWGSGGTGINSERSSQGGVWNSTDGALTSTNGSHSHSVTSSDSETRPKNIALNFYCLVSE